MKTAEDLRFALVYDEALRALVRQQGAVDELRARSIAILSAASIVAAFLGGLALDERSRSITGLSVVAVAAFAVVGVASVFVLWPRRWRFATSARETVANYITTDSAYTLDQMRWEMAEHFEDRYDLNDPGRRHMRWAVTVQCSALIVEVVSWLILLGGRASG